ncbi:hypothetical protein BC834DRAFT_879489, partial [Gloeopeniophorella convolvens]
MSVVSSVTEPCAAHNVPRHSGYRKTAEVACTPGDRKRLSWKYNPLWHTGRWGRMMCKP